jgi:hypothetical protein
MSRFAPEMDRNGIQWQDPTGTWKQAQDIVHLDTIAKRLVIPADLDNTDVLNSIPTPWSRLLLFENALFSEQHPSHGEVLSQWRGLLGLLALANPLGINVDANSEARVMNLKEFSDKYQIAKSFVDLRPSRTIDKIDVEDGKWHQFHLIAVDGQLLGATSPRTLVFTAIAHHCPAAIPFQNSLGRLADPLPYFTRFGDRKYLVLLKQWIDTFLSGIQGNQELISWLGTFPAAPDLSAKRRYDALVALLQDWQTEITRSVPRMSPAISTGQPVPFFTLSPYRGLGFLPPVTPSEGSDLLLATEKAANQKVVVCFRPDRNSEPARNSVLYNEYGQIAQSENLLICDGRWVNAQDPLPDELDFLPPGWTYISDPIEQLFEDRIIEVQLPDAPEDAGSAYTLQVGKKHLLFPFKASVLDYFTPAELGRYTSVAVESDHGYRITLQLPLVKGRSVRATRVYEASANELLLINNTATDHVSSELALWPNFAHPDWSYYFYFKQQLAPKDQPERNLDFTPVDGGAPRLSPDGATSWYFVTKPVAAFAGKVAGHSGLLLPRYEELPPVAEKDYWSLSVDLGSTHTRVFYVRRQKEDDGRFTNAPNVEIEPLEFTAYARQLTVCDPFRLKKNFFALTGKLDPPTRMELKTLLMKPVNDNTGQPDWRPREGFAYMHWIKEKFEDRNLNADIKWEANGSRGELKAFLRCLMIMVKAEAARRNAEIIFVTRSFPTAFNNRLRADHNQEWVSLGRDIGLEVESEHDKVLSEALATARYLASREAPQTINTVSLDIGGSTTDIAIWHGKKVRSERGERLRAVLGLQESVKMAAGSVGRYVQADRQASREFVKWFHNTVKAQGVFSDASLASFAGRHDGYALMFYNILSYYELKRDQLQGGYNALVGLIQTRPEARGLVTHLIYLFGSLVYYAGLLARKVGLEEKNPPVYYLYFCGKGGTLITWIDNHEKFIEKLFLAGLHGPDSANQETQTRRTEVSVHLSPQPKEEVGRGLLVPLTSRHGVEGDDGDSFGLVDPAPLAVTVAETGYKINQDGNATELSWKDKLDRGVLRILDDNLPSFAEMKELNCFINAVKEAFKHEDEGEQKLDFDKLLASESEKYAYRDRLMNRLIGPEEGGVLHDLEQEDNPNALVEPLLITEMKVLLEFLSDNSNLFR